MEDGAATSTHGKDIGGGAAPDTIKDICGAAAHGAPGAAIVVQDGATIPHGEDIGGGAAPDTLKPGPVEVLLLLMALQELPS